MPCEFCGEDCESRAMKKWPCDKRKRTYVLGVADGAPGSTHEERVEFLLDRIALELWEIKYWTMWGDRG